MQNFDVINYTMYNGKMGDVPVGYLSRIQGKFNFSYPSKNFRTC